VSDVENQNLSTRFVKRIESLNNFQKSAVWVLSDFLCFCIGSVAAYIFYTGMINPRIEGYFLFTVVAFLINIVVSRVFNLNTRINRYSGMRDLFSLFLSFLLSGSISGLITIFFDFIIALRYMILSGILAGLAATGIRVLWQNIYLLKDRRRAKNGDTIKQAIVEGEGDGGSHLV